MSQDPSIGPYTKNDILDRLAIDVFGKNSRTDLTANQQTSLGTMVDERMQMVYDIWRRFADDDISSGNLPDSAQQLIYRECYLAAWELHREKSEKWQSIREENLRLWAEVLDSYSVVANSAPYDTSYKNIDRYVVLSVMKTLLDDRQRRVIPPSPAIVDQCSKHQFTYLWNWCRWPFRYRLGTFTIDTDGNLNSDQSLVFDQLGVRRFHYRDHPGESLDWIEHDTFNALRASYYGTTGRPRWFQVQDEGTAKKIMMLPTPDQEYVVYANILIATPSLPDTRTGTTGFSSLPAEFHPILWDMVLADVLEKMSYRKLAGVLHARVTSFLDNKGQEFADYGRAPGTIATHDVYNDDNYLGSNWRGYIGG